MAHIGEKFTLGLIGFFGLVASQFQLILHLLAFGDILGILDHLDHLAGRVENRISVHLGVYLIAITIIVNVFQDHRLLCLLHYLQRTGIILTVAGFILSMSQCVARQSALCSQLPGSGIHYLDRVVICVNHLERMRERIESTFQKILLLLNELLGLPTFADVQQRCEHNVDLPTVIAHT